ncbi:NUDIX hydrolase [Paludibacterium purpuratum]|uniref:Phosphatase NudJ n=1 Tax=Paludibacterium purpuratum TaxID=1144873 RepID=A0A4R7B842_9NEIS|nr:NUDIX hydrolase [Paludibacterium purpuratum]TDR80032.1 ADP-ribose pyrophosphatase YjhB (NUDIX family) [Paludibacterium purpuratum]
MERWKPHVTVAAVIERDGRFLLVRERTADGIRYNQPAGHLEHGETLIDAVAREALEETGWQVKPQALLGIYQAESLDGTITYLRFAFICQAEREQPNHPLDDGILDTHWLTPTEVRERELRSPTVLRCIDDYLAGQRYPLSLIQTLA